MFRNIDFNSLFQICSFRKVVGFVIRGRLLNIWQFTGLPKDFPANLYFKSNMIIQCFLSVLVKNINEKYFLSVLVFNEKNK